MEGNIEQNLDNLIEEIKTGKGVTDKNSLLKDLIPIIKTLAGLPKVKPSAISLNATLLKINTIAQRKHRSNTSDENLSWIHLLSKRIFLKPAIAFTTLLLFVISSFILSHNSLPGDILYPVKIFKENVKAHFITNPNDKAKYHIARANKRLKEMENIITQINRKTSKETVAHINEHTEKAFQHTINLPDEDSLSMLNKLEQLYSKHREILVHLRSITPPENYAYIDKSIELCNDRIDWISQLKDDN